MMPKGRQNTLKAGFPPEVFEDLAYTYDGTLEGLLSAIFEAFARHENPRDIEPECMLQPRLAQLVSFIQTNEEHAERVRRGICSSCGYRAFNAVKKAALSSAPGAGTAAYRFVRFAMGAANPCTCAPCKNRSSCHAANTHMPCPRIARGAISNITHPSVEPLFKIARSVDNECERMRQFIRFEHLNDAETDIWFARCNPRDSVVPLVMNHFVERFNVQPFIIYDENHHIAGVYEGKQWYLVRTNGKDNPFPRIPSCAAEEETMQRAWKTFYHAVSIDARYNPELRRHFMPKRLWKNLTEMQESLPARENKTGRDLSQPAHVMEPATGIEPATH